MKKCESEKHKKLVYASRRLHGPCYHRRLVALKLNCDEEVRPLHGDGSRI